MLAEEKCLEADVQLRYYETPVKAEFKGNKWEVESVGKGTHIKIICNQLIDCTGNAYVTSLNASAPLEDVVSFSGSFAGDGALSKETVT